MSDATILWWGRDVYLYHAGNFAHRPMAEKSDLVGVVIAALGGLATKPKRLRLVYQPADMEHRTESCPKAGRGLLRKSLAPGIPQLQNPDIAWGALTPKPVGDESYSTVVFYEARPRLSRICSALAAKGFPVVGAWPLARLVEAQLTNSDESSVAIVHADEHVMVYSCNPVGERDVTMHEGPDAREMSIIDIRKAFSQFDDGVAPVLQVGHGPEWHIALPESANVTQVSMPDLMRQAEGLRLDETSNLVAPESRLTPSLIAKIASVALLAVAGFLAYQGLTARSIATRELQQIVKVRNDLKIEAARFAANKDRADHIQSFLSEAFIEPLGRGQFLDAVSRNCTPAVTLTMIRASELGFVISGVASEGFGQKTGPFFTLVDALTNAPDKLWTIPPENRPLVLGGPEFTLSGRFGRAAPTLRSSN